MGYDTNFSGRFILNKPLTKGLHDYLVKFSETRRMTRDLSRLPRSDSLNKDFGVEGEFYVDGRDDDYNDPSIIDYNRPPKTQPGLWCQWVPSEDLTGIEWDGNEKFYNYKEWMKYILKNFLVPKGYDISGKIHYQGEDAEDHGDLDGAQLTHEVLSEMNIQTIKVKTPPAPVKKSPSRKINWKD